MKCTHGKEICKHPAWKVEQCYHCELLTLSCTQCGKIKSETQKDIPPIPQKKGKVALLLIIIFTLLKMQMFALPIE